MRVYVSSRDRTEEDHEIRGAARAAIRSMGHEPAGFESLSPRPLPPRGALEDEFLPLVRASDFVIVVVRDEVTSAMSREIETARESLGDTQLAYIFEAGVKRDSSADGLRAHASGGYIHTSFKTNAELTSAILRVFGGLAEGGLSRLTAVSNRPYSGRIHLPAGATWERKIDVPRDGAVSVHVRSRGFFNALLLSESESWWHERSHEPYRFWSGDGPTREYSRTCRSTEPETWTVVIARDDLPLPPLGIDIDLVANFSPLVSPRTNLPGLWTEPASDGGLPMLVGGQPLVITSFPNNWRVLDDEMKAYFAKTVVVYLRASFQKRPPVDTATRKEIQDVIQFYDLVDSGRYSGKEGYGREFETALLGIARSAGFLPGIDLADFDTRRFIQLGAGLPRLVDSRGNRVSILGGLRGRPSPPADY